MAKTFSEHLAEHTAHGDHPGLDAVIAAAHVFQKALADNMPDNAARERNIAIFDDRVLGIAREFASEFRNS